MRFSLAFIVFLTAPMRVQKPAARRFLLLLAVLLAFSPALVSGAPERYCLETEIRKLPGGLDNTPCFNSNSPEMVFSDGILLSTFPAEGMKHPEAHLDYAFNGRFDLFSHHVTKSETDADDRCLYLGYIMGNPGNKKVRIQVLSGASYLSQPDAPFVNLPEVCLNNEGKLFSGPGDRVTDDVMRGKKPDFISKAISLAPGETKLVLCLPVPVRNLRPALNGRSTLLKLKSNGPVYLASLAMFSKRGGDGAAPPESDWLASLAGFDLATPRDVAPTPPGHKGAIKYGRVSGVARGTEWNGTLLDEAGKAYLLRIPEPGKSFTYPFSTVEGGTFGTKQVESAEMIVRYKDTAYQAHGNYASRYKIDIPLFNPYPVPMNLELLFQSALKSDLPESRLCFYESAPPRAFFRGTVLCKVGSNSNYWHLIQKQGAEGAKLAELTMLPGAKKNISLEFLYPPDATPPQELCIRTLSEHQEEPGN